LTFFLLIQADSPRLPTSPTTRLHALAALDRTLTRQLTTNPWEFIPDNAQSRPLLLPSEEGRALRHVVSGECGAEEMSDLRRSRVTGIPGTGDPDGGGAARCEHYVQRTNDLVWAGAARCREP
jgi:hypothetical protein